MSSLTYREDAISRVGKNFVDSQGRTYRVTGVDFTFLEPFLFFFTKRAIGIRISYLQSSSDGVVVPYSEHRMDKISNLELS